MTVVNSALTCNEGSWQDEEAMAKCQTHMVLLDIYRKGGSIMAEYRDFLDRTLTKWLLMLSQLDIAERLFEQWTDSNLDEGTSLC
jgi:hypothetical protein